MNPNPVTYLQMHFISRPNEPLQMLDIEKMCWPYPAEFVLDCLRLLCGMSLEERTLIIRDDPAETPHIEPCIEFKGWLEPRYIWSLQ